MGVLLINTHKVKHVVWTVWTFCICGEVNQESNTVATKITHTILLNSNKSTISCNNFPVYYPDAYLQLNMFRAFFRPLSGAQWLQWQPLVLPSYRGDSRAVFVVGPAGPTTNTSRLSPRYEKPEAAAAVIELLMMCGKTLETCWALNKRQGNKTGKLLHLVGDLFELCDDARTYKH
jgi:hypothetical protein